MKKTQYQNGTIQHLSTTAFRSIQAIKRTGLLLMAAQTFVLSTHAFDCDQNSDAFTTTTTSCSTTASVTAPQTTTQDGSTQIVPAQARTSDMDPVFAPVLNMPNELLVLMTDFMDNATLKSFQTFVNIAEKRYHAENNHKDQKGNLQKNELLQDEAIISHIMPNEAHDFIESLFGEAAAPINEILNFKLQTDREEYMSFIDSLMCPQNKQILHSGEITKLLIKESPCMQLLVTAHAHRLFTENINFNNKSFLISSISQAYRTLSYCVFEAILFHVPQLFTVNMNEMDRTSIIRSFYKNPTIFHIENFCRTVSAHMSELFRPNMEGWEGANIIMDLNNCLAYSAIATHASQLFSPSMGMMDINQIIQVLATHTSHEVCELAEQFTETMTVDERIELIERPRIHRIERAERSRTARIQNLALIGLDRK